MPNKQARPNIGPIAHVRPPLYVGVLLATRGDDSNTKS